MDKIEIMDFERSGIARLKDIQGDVYKKLFSFLESEQESFFENSKLLMDENYFKKWPKDTLHWWSRIWEYLYVFCHIKKLLRQREKSEKYWILGVDVGMVIIYYGLILI